MRNVLVATAMVLLFACAGSGRLVGSDFTSTGPRQPAIAVDRVALIFGGHAAGPYRELGVVEVSFDPGQLSITGGAPDVGVSYQDVLAELRRVGAGAGCDGLLVNPTQYPPGLLRVVSATCIAYLPVASAAAPAQGR